MEVVGEGMINIDGNRKKNKKELSTENKMIIFPSNLKHAGTTHTDSLQRIVLNFNYYI